MLPAIMGQNLSHPVRVRGLKHHIIIIGINGLLVAPRAGAWIETEHVHARCIKGGLVAPRAGAWIETRI